MDQTKLQDALITITVEFRRMQQELEQLPKTEGDLQAMLFELADAADDKSEHFNRFPRSPGINRSYASDVANEATVEADWSRCLKRYEEAQAKLVLYAKMVRDAK